jgi:hypothetical protein
VRREIQVLRAEYDRALNFPLFDSPLDYCVLLDLITDKLEELEEENA